jgi:hypothetical protein
MVADQLHINEIRRLLDSQRIEGRRAIAENDTHNHRCNNIDSHNVPKAQHNYWEESELQQVMLF